MQICKEHGIMLVKCIQCQEYKSTEMPYNEALGWLQIPRGERPLIQDAFPKSAPGERDLLLLQICEPCYDTMFGEPDDD